MQQQMQQKQVVSQQQIKPGGMQFSKN
jgi:hypothetical protein